MYIFDIYIPPNMLSRKFSYMHSLYNMILNDEDNHVVWHIIVHCIPFIKPSVYAAYSTSISCALFVCWEGFLAAGGYGADRGRGVFALMELTCSLGRVEGT